MAVPILALAAVKAMAPIAAKVALKAYFLGKMAALKSFLVSTLGATAAQVSLSVLAAGCAAAVYQKSILGNNDQSAVEAAVAKGMSEDVAWQVLAWVKANPVF